jgi:hypothetical protein
MVSDDLPGDKGPGHRVVLVTREGSREIDGPIHG